MFARSAAAVDLLGHGGLGHYRAQLRIQFITSPGWPRTILHTHGLRRGLLIFRTLRRLSFAIRLNP